MIAFFVVCAASFVKVKTKDAHFFFFSLVVFFACQVHAYIIGYLRSQMPSMMGKEKVQKKLTAGE